MPHQYTFSSPNLDGKYAKQEEKHDYEDYYGESEDDCSDEEPYDDDDNSLDTSANSTYSANSRSSWDSQWDSHGPDRTWRSNQFEGGRSDSSSVASDESVGSNHSRTSNHSQNSEHSEGSHHSNGSAAPQVSDVTRKLMCKDSDGQRHKHVEDNVEDNVEGNDD